MPKGKYPKTEEHRNKIRETLKKKGIRPKGQPPTEKRARGEQNGSWKGGVLTLNQKLRKSLEYKLWRESVFKRDNFTCIWCGDNRGGNLHADHIKPFAYYPELRFAIDNGRTLCVPCHRKTDTFGRNKP